MSSSYKISWALVAFLFLVTQALANGGSGPANKASTAVSMMPMPMVAPMFLETGEFSSALYMVNGLRIPATAKVTLFDMNGNEIREEEIKFDPDTEHHLSIRQELDAAGSPVVAGSLRVETLTGNGMGILAQLAITHHGAKEQYFDEELAMPSAMGSSMLRAVADATGGAVVVSITNLASNSVQSVTTVGIGEGRPVTKAIRLEPNQTKFVRPCSPEAQDQFDGVVDSDFGKLASSAQAACGVSIISDGRPGELAAYGIAYHPGEGQNYFSALNFSDPKVLRSAGTVYPGVAVGAASLLPEGNYGVRLMLVNFGTRDSQVTVQYASTSNEQTRAQTLANIKVAANTTKITEFTNLTGDPSLQNSFVVRSDASPGIVLSKLVSFGDGALREVEILGKDEKQLENTGNHPWSIEDGVTSTLILFNHADKEQTFFVKVGGDKLVWRKDYVLSPMETRAISINGLIASEAKDDKGSALPRDMHRGEVVWLAPHTSEVSGRILQSDKLLAMARNFSCGTCGFLCGGILNPNSSLTTFVGGTGDLGDITPDYCDVPCQTYTSCPSGNSTTSGTTYYSWSGGGSVASLVSGETSSMSTWKGNASGYTTVTYAMTMGEGSGYSCTGQTTAKVKPTISGVSPAQGLVGTAENVTITGTGFAAGATVTVPNVSVSNIKVTSATQITATFTPTNSSSAAGDQAITVTVAGQPSNSTNFYVQVPTHFQRYNQPPEAPGGLGPVVPVTNGNVVDLAGNILATHFCGVYENFLYDIADQQNNQITNGTVTVTEVFSKIKVPPGPTPSVTSHNLSSQGVGDTQAYGYTYPTCLSANQNQALNMTWTVQVGTVTYPITTLLNITLGNFNGTLEVNSTITTP